MAWSARPRGEQDAAAIHTAAFAGLRIGELLALRWRDVDFAQSTIRVSGDWALGKTTTPRGGSERAVPMATENSGRLARLGQFDQSTGEDDLVFCAERGQHVGSKSLRQRYHAALKDAGLREGSGSTTCASTVIRKADSREVMEWMGHADLSTTRRYLVFKQRGQELRLAGVHHTGTTRGRSGSFPVRPSFSAKLPALLRK